MIDYLRELNFVSIALRLLLSAVIGFSLGMERGRKRRPAGCRTYMLVCMGATLTLLLSQYEYYMLTNRWYDLALEIGIRTDVSRFGAQVINGVGFLGAGTILVTGRREVKGLTTAAGLWASACMGLAIGAGFYECVVLGTVLIFLSMRFLPTIENMMVERAPFLNIYVEFESLDNIGAIIGRIKEQNSQILDVEIEPEGRLHDGLDDAVNTGYLIEKLEMNPEYKLVSYEMPEQEQGHLSCTLGELFTGLELKLA